MTPASPNNIIVHNNFLSKKDLNKILLFCENQTTWVNSTFYTKGKLQTYPDQRVNFSNSNSEVFNLFTEILRFIQDKIEWTYGTRLIDKKTESESVRKWSPGDSQEIHADNERANGGFISLEYITDKDQYLDESEHSLPNDFIEYSSVFYINDNYIGGELFFPEYDVKIKPKAGTFITWPSNAKYMHGVCEITDGYRYTIPGIWYSEKAVLLNSIKSFKCARRISEENYSNKFVKTSIL
jgi:hypothetical protein